MGLMVWIGPDYSQATDAELLADYDAHVKEIQKRFKRRKSKKK